MSSQNGRVKNQIDHLMIDRKWRRFLLDVKVRREADVGSHHGTLWLPLLGLSLEVWAKELGAQGPRCR